MVMILTMVTQVIRHQWPPIVVIWNCSNITIQLHVFDDNILHIMMVHETLSSTWVMYEQPQVMISNDLHPGVRPVQLWAVLRYITADQQHWAPQQQHSLCPVQWCCCPDWRHSSQQQSTAVVAPVWALPNLLIWAQLCLVIGSVN